MQETIFRQIESIASKSSSDDIFIIGKGPSLDSVDCSALPVGVIININDSERVRVGDVAVFSANWVRHSLREEGFRSGFYLAGRPLPSEVPHVVLPQIPIDLDHEDLNLLRVEREEFYDEAFVLLNALKVCLRLAALRGKSQNVYLLGFDFSTHGGSISRKAGTDYSGATNADREAIVAAQEHEFRQFTHYFEKGDRLKLIHVGNRDFSSLAPTAFNRKIRGLAVGTDLGPINFRDPDRVLIVAELTNNHLGDPKRLVEMIERSKEAGADLIKVQKRHVDSFYSKEQLESYYWSPYGTTLGEYRKGVELSDEMLALLDETCRKLKIEWFCSVLDLPSFVEIAKFKPNLIKIPSTISNHRDFHSSLAETYTGAIVISTGFTEEEYVDYILETFSQNEVIYLLHCISAYPTPREDCNIAIVRAYRSINEKIPKVIPGYSSHDLGSIGSMLAVASGARMLEKHVKLGDVDWVHFDKVAIDLTMDDFAKFVQDVRAAEQMLGSGKKRILDSEHHKYQVNRS